MLYAPIGLALRGSRDSPLRADAIGIDVPRLQWIAFVVAGTVAGLAGALFAFAKGTISPETLGVGKSVDGLVMVLLGGVQTLSGPWVGAALFTWLQDTVARQTDYWRALLGHRDARARPRLSARRRGRAEALVHPRGGPRHERLHGLLRCAGLSKSFGGVRAVDDVSFDLGAGEMLALIGPNGAGKTTCFNMVNGQLAPDAGSVRLGGVELVGLKPRGGLAPGRRPHVPDRRDLRFADGARERAARAALARATACSRSGARRACSSPTRPTRCSRSVGMVDAGGAGDERARLRRRQARRAGDRARQPAAPAADGRADRRHGARRSATS